MKRILLVTILIALTAVSGLAAADIDYTHPDTLKTLLESEGEDYLFLDVRTGPEYGAGHIPGAKLIPITSSPRRFRKPRRRMI